MATRWGICGTGLISNDFTTVLKSLPDSEHQVVAVAARSDQSKATSFAEKYGIPASYGTYEDMAKDVTVEIVYVGVVHPFHKEVCLLFLDHGKHVLCEKPLAMTLKEAEEVIAKAREKKLFFMEGIWTRFYPAYRAMVEELDSGSLGDIVCVRSTLVLPCAELCAANNRPLLGGVLLGMGPYPLAYIQQVFRDKPEKVVAVGQFLEGGGDIGCCVTLQYKGGQVGMAYLHGGVSQGGSTVTIHGTKGSLTVDGFSMHTPSEVRSSVTGETRHFPLPDIQGPFNWWNSNGFLYEAQAVRQCLLKGRTECPLMTHEDSLTIMHIMDEIAKQLGLQ